MFMVASSVVTTIMILNYHHRQADTHEMPHWVSHLSTLLDFRIETELINFFYLLATNGIK